MAIDFPASPTNGQTYVVGSVTYTWDGTKWTAIASGGGGGSGDIIIEGDTSAEVIDTGSDGRFVVTTEGTEAFRVDDSQRLLVGTSSSSENVIAAFQGFQGSSTGQGIIAIKRGSTPSSGNTVAQIRFNGPGTDEECAYITASADGTWGAGDYPGRLMFSTTADGASSPTERMRIANDGESSIYGQGSVLNCRTASTSSTTDVLMVRNGASSTTTGTIRFSVKGDGDCENTNNSYGALSDIKLKENIADANSQWSDIKALQVRKYNFKPETGHSTHTQIGLIAQEVELVSPGLVSESPDRDAEGNDLGTTTKSVNYSVLYMKAVKALQEAMERIETLEAKVAALENPTV